jgi:hypothetical protein
LPFTAIDFTVFLEENFRRYETGEIEGDESIALVFDNA